MCECETCFSDAVSFEGKLTPRLCVKVTMSVSDFKEMNTVRVLAPVYPVAFELNQSFHLLEFGFKTC